jgi:hypothetical protein
MTTTLSRKKTPEKPLRIRPELLPDSATYGTFSGREYVMIPVEEFGEWYEDVEDGAVVRYTRDNPEPGTPFEEVQAELARGRKAVRK